MNNEESVEGHVQQSAFDLRNEAAMLVRGFSQHGQRNNLDQAIELLRQSLDLLPPGHPELPNFMDNLGSTITQRFKQAGHHQADLDEAISLHREALVLRDDNAPQLSDTISKLANILWQQKNARGQRTRLDEGIALHRKALGLRRPGHKGRPYTLTNLATALSNRYDQEDRRDDLDEAIALYRQALDLRLQEQPDWHISLNNLATVLLDRYYRDCDQRDRDEALQLQKKSLDAREPDHPSLSHSLTNLANAYSQIFVIEGTQNNLDQSISLHRQAYDITPPENPRRAIIRRNLMTVLHMRPEQLKTPKDSDEIIYLYRQALDAITPPDYHTSYNILVGLVNVLEEKKAPTGLQIHLPEIISLRRKILEMTPRNHAPRDHDEYSINLDRLGCALVEKFKQVGDPDALEEAISLHRQCIASIRPGGHMCPDFLNNLATALSRYFTLNGDMVDINEAIAIHRRTLSLREADDPGKVETLHNLAAALAKQFTHTGTKEVLNEAIDLHRQALELRPIGHPQRSESLSKLANTLWQDIDEFGQHSKLEEGIKLHMKARELRALNPLLLSSTLTNLARPLTQRFKQSGQQSDLNESIMLHRKALDMRLPGNPNRSDSLQNLATTLLYRFRESNRQEDIDEAVIRHRQALDLRGPGHPYRSVSVNHLATALYTRSVSGGPRCDIEEAISLYREAITLRPVGNRNRSTALSDLAIVLGHRFALDSQISDLEEAVSLQGEALEASPPGHLNRANAMNNLAATLADMCLQKGQRTLIDEAISLCKEALTLLPLKHSRRSYTLHSLGSHYEIVYLYFSKNNEDLESAICWFSSALKCPMSPFQCLSMANAWAAKAEQHRHHSAINAYDIAIKALPELASHSLDIQSRHRALTSGTDGLARKAAQCAIENNDFIRAVEYLEAGRAVFWSQVLQLRSPFDRLCKVAPEVAQKMEGCAGNLERGSFRSTVADILDNSRKITLEEEASNMNRVSEEWSKLLAEVRRMEGFEDFLKPRQLSALRVAAAGGPLIFLIPNETDSHCLVMTSDSEDVQHIRLPALSNNEVRRLVSLTLLAASRSEVLESSIQSIVNNQKNNASSVIKQLFRGQSEVADDERLNARRASFGVNGAMIPSNTVFEQVLMILWTEIVMPVIVSLKIQKSTGRPTLQWCPAGLFTFLPIHASGCYSSRLGAIECASDYIVSSYTPTVEALISQGETNSVSPKEFKILAIADTKNLYATTTELEKIKSHVPSNCLVELGIKEVPANIDTVLSNLPMTSIVHFACHGKQDRLNPLHSALLVDDGELTISRIMEKPLPNGSLAFLCACETARGDETLPDEAISLGASMLFAGFRSVIATMWKMMDNDGPTVADAFYKELFNGHDGMRTFYSGHSGHSARALDIAVQKLRQNRAAFREWVPYIHLGR